MRWRSEPFAGEAPENIHDGRHTSVLLNLDGITAMNTKRVYLLSALVALIGILALCFYMAYPRQYAEQMLVENASIHDNEMEHEAHDGREVAAHYFAGYTGISSMVMHPDGKQVFALIDGAVISFDYALG